MELQGGDMDLGLRILLHRPSVDDLPESEQLKHYYQRDFKPSHLYRTGVKLFGKEIGTRKRVIFAPSYNEVDSSNHLDKITLPDKDIKSSKVPVKLPLFVAADSPSNHDEDYFKNWISERKALRHNLENFGNCEQWLQSKHCTPLESNVLKQIKVTKNNRQLITIQTATTESVSVEADELTMAERNRLKRREKRQLMKDLKKLEHFIGLSRTRLSGYLVSFDQNRTCILPRNIVIGILDKIRVPVEGFVVDILCDAIEENGAIDYRLLFKGGYCNMVEKYMNRLDQAERNVNRDTSKELCVEKDDRRSGVVNGGFSDSRDRPLENLGSTNLLTFSTMEGKIGEWSETIKEESYRQFMKLIDFCQKHDVTLDYSLVKRGLLIPQDRTRKQCLSQLRQAGAEAPSNKIVELPVTERDTVDSDPHDLYGWQYKELRGSRGARRVKLSTGIVRVKAKTDCWLTYKQFQQITEEIQARPGFDYKYHGLPPNNAFWPGALLDKLRLHLPIESLETKPYSLRNIFQNVTHPKLYNPFVPVDSTKGMAWPENSSGHVQLGPSLARTRKTYII